jgi:hypothetical protein
MHRIEPRAGDRIFPIAGDGGARLPPAACAVTARVRTAYTAVNARLARRPRRPCE